MISFSGTTYYNIHVSIGSVNWTVRHRYKEFVELHTKLVNGQSIGRDLLPPKKVNTLTLRKNKLKITVYNSPSNFVVLIRFQGHWQSITSIFRTTSERFGKVFAKSAILFAASNVP